MTAVELYDHTSKDDLIELASDASEGIDQRTKLAVSLSLIATGFMVSSSHAFNFILPKIVNADDEQKRRVSTLHFSAILLGQHVPGEGAILERMVTGLVAALNSDATFDADRMWEETMQHMVNGKDMYDPKSAGGWDGNELRSFIETLELYGWESARLQSAPRL